MGTATFPHPVKLITGIIASSENGFSESEALLQKEFGSIDYKSDILKFDFTNYYQKDMGSGLKRCFFSFERLIDPADLADVKLITNKLEDGISKAISDAKRPVNIDPGYLSDAKLVLASTKNHSHRIYLDRKSVV